MATRAAYTRRQELTCTVDELTTYGSKILLNKEVLYVKQTDGRYAVKIGDGSTAIKDLPYSINYSDINSLKTAAETAASTATAQAKIAADKATETTNIGETKKKEITTLTETKKQELETLTTTKQQEIADTGAEVLSSIPTDYTALSTQVTENTGKLSAMGFSVVDGQLCVTYEEEDE